MRKLATLVAALLVSSSASAATPPEGVPLQVRRGFFTETDVGGIFTVGGDNGYSNFQTYLQLGMGYQLTIGNGQGMVPIGVHVGIGANAQNCWADLKADLSCTQADNFTLTFISLTGGYLHRVVERLFVGGKAMVGWTLLDPAPVLSATNADVRGGLNLGVAASIEYATNMDHFSIGFDAVFRVVVGPNILSLQFFPRVQYTF